jgi:hypothetical protein
VGDGDDHEVVEAAIEVELGVGQGLERQSRCRSE